MEFVKFAFLAIRSALSIQYVKETLEISDKENLSDFDRRLLKSEAKKKIEKLQTVDTYQEGQRIVNNLNQ